MNEKALAEILHDLYAGELQDWGPMGAEATAMHGRLADEPPDICVFWESVARSLLATHEVKPRITFIV